MSLDKLMRLSGGDTAVSDPDADLLLAAQAASRELVLLLASDGDDEHDYRGGGKKNGDSEKDGDGGGGDHSGHATFKALCKKNVPPDRAASMCAKADKNVKATQLARALEVILSGRPGTDVGLVTLTPASETAEGRRKAAGEGDALSDGSYPIKSKRQLHSAAVLAASHHGDWKAAQSLIRKKAREFGVNVDSLPGFGSGGSESDGEKAAASMLALAKAAQAVAMHHAPFTGTHSHPHAMAATHEHDHQHYGDNSHSGGPLHRPGSEPRRDW